MDDRKLFEDFRKYAQEKGRGTNLENPVFTKEVNTVTPDWSRDSPSYGGKVNSNFPGTVFINPDSRFNKEEVLAHEAEHLQQLEAEKFIQKALKEGNYPRNFSIPGTSNNYRIGDGELPIDRAFRDIRKNAKELTPEIRKKYQLGKDFHNDDSEFMADMVAFESSLPSGKSIFNTDIGRTIFKTPEQRQAYLTASMPNTTKFLPRETTFADKFRDAKSEFKDVASKSSYAKAAIAAAKKTLGSESNAKGMKKGGSVSSASKRADGIAQRGKTKGRMC
jgi:hypothetical protein